MAKEKKVIIPGQTVWVSTTDHFNASEPGLVEHVVARVNSSSIYVTGKEVGYEKRFGKRTLTRKNGTGTNRIWLDPNEYWNMVELRQERKNLHELLEQLLPQATVVQLREVKQILGEPR